MPPRWTLFVTHISAATGAATWALIEWKTIGKPSVLGIATGSIAGLAAIYASFWSCRSVRRSANRRRFLEHSAGTPL